MTSKTPSIPVNTDKLRDKILKVADNEDKLRERRKAINAKITSGNQDLLAEGLAPNAKRFAINMRRLEPDEQIQELLSLDIFLSVFEIESPKQADIFELFPQEEAAAAD